MSNDLRYDRVQYKEQSAMLKRQHWSGSFFLDCMYFWRCCSEMAVRFSEYIDDLSRIWRTSYFWKILIWYRFLCEVKFMTKRVYMTVCFQLLTFIQWILKFELVQWDMLSHFFAIFHLQLASTIVELSRENIICFILKTSKLHFC